MFNYVLRATDMAKSYVEKVLKCGDTAVDATLGNGNDTILLSSIVGNGRVYSFEIQDLALDKFEKIMTEKNVSNVTLIRDSHEYIEKYVNEQPRVIMYNLGYLPGGDKGIRTLRDSTLKSLEGAVKILKTGGLITIASYTGHEGGEEEAYGVEEFIKNLPKALYSTAKIEYFSKKRKAPSLYLIEKGI